MSKKQIGLIIAVIIGLFIGIGVFTGLVGICNQEEYIVVQPLWGDVYVQDNPGPYLKFFAKTWAYPKYLQYIYNDTKDEGDLADERTRITFNDGGTAMVSDMIMVAAPALESDRIKFHEFFGHDFKRIKISVRGFKKNVMKATASLMSATENQSARKAEYQQLVETQLKIGIYDMKKFDKVLKDQFDDSGKPITIPATEIVLNEKGEPIVVSESPVAAAYKMMVIQYSVEDIDYDEKTREQFAAKKESYLNAERSKAQREEMVQERLMVVEKFEKEKAEVKGEADKVKEKAVIEAQQKAEVALQAKQEAETKASMALEVAKIEKDEAQVRLDKAELDAKAIERLAEAERKKIELAGALTELEQAKIEAQVKMADTVSSNLAKVNVPVITMNTSGGAGTGGTTASGLDMSLVNLKMLVDSGVLEKFGIDKSAIERQITRNTDK